MWINYGLLNKVTFLKETEEIKLPYEPNRADHAKTKEG